MGAAADLLIGGRIRFAKPSKFTIRLHFRALLTEGSIAGRSVATLNDVHVLVVDDNKQMRFLVRCLLRAGGISKVTEAETGSQAFDVMRARPVDLIIVDWKMAPVDGLAFTLMVRRNHDSPNPYIPILMLTAHTEISRVAAARDAGVSGFVRKPISAQLLFDRISNVLTDTRLFVRNDTFFGPDRRFGQDPHYAGPLRRETDRLQPNANEGDEALDVDDLRWTA